MINDVSMKHAPEPENFALHHLDRKAVLFEKKNQKTFIDLD
jgi:hypothetical protein